jgi:hypothetical protein
MTIHLLSDPFRLPGMPLVGWNSSIPKTWGFSTKMTMVGYPVVTPNLIYLSWAWTSKNCVMAV